MRRRLFSLSFSLLDFERSENEKCHWCYSKSRLERVKGIEPSPQNSEFAQNQALPQHAEADYTQGRAQIPDAASPDLAKVVAAWTNLPAALKAAILAIVNSSEVNR